MRVIICGAGQVGYNIAAYLAREDNDITLIDSDNYQIARINDELDVNAIVGQASHPDVLDAAGAEEADLIIAVTHQDEVNMVACQVAHSLFGVPKKIARIREAAYMHPAWSNLFSRSHMPIDVIVSPERETAQAIAQRVGIPGTTNVISFADEQAHLVGVNCQEDCPVVHTQIKQFAETFPDLPLKVALIIRGMKVIFPNGNEQMMVGDEVYFFTDSEHLQRALSVFGHEEKKARNITIMGGGNIGRVLAEILRKEQSRVKLKIIEKDMATSIRLSESMTDVIVLQGDGLASEILDEANVESSETFIAVTNDDETNILASLLAKQRGCERVMTLVNNPSYTPLIAPLEIDAAVVPRALTISSIMQHVRRGRIKALHTLRDGVAEVIEAEVSKSSELSGKTIEELDLPCEVIIGMLVRDNEILMPHKDFRIEEGDHVIILASAGQIRKIEQMFSVHVDLF